MLFRSPELKKQFLDQGLDLIAGASPQDAARFVREDVERWARVVKLSGAKGN